MTHTINVGSKTVTVHDFDGSMTRKDAETIAAAAITQPLYFNSCTCAMWAYDFVSASRWCELATLDGSAARALAVRAYDYAS